MKKYFLIISLGLILSSCASNTLQIPEQRGSACFEVETQKNTFETRCYPARLYLDSTRFHKLNDYQKDHMPKMP